MGFLLEALPNWLVVVTALLATLFAWLHHKHTHFRRRNAPHMQPWPIVGNLGPLIFRQSSLSDLTATIYRHFEGKSFGGFYEFLNPVILIRDPELLRRVCVKDFDHFQDHRAIVGDDINPILSKTVLSLQGQAWRDMRSTLSPAFTSGKIKAMFALVEDCGKRMSNQMVKRIEELPDSSDKMVSIEMKDFISRYTNDVIATIAFGITCDSYKDVANEFYMMGKASTAIRGLKAIVAVGYFFSGRLMRFLGLSLMQTSASRFFQSIINQTVRKREEEGIVRPDMIHLLMQSNRGELKSEASDEVDSHSHHHKKLVLSDSDVAAQALIFYLAGFETTSALLSCATNHLAVNPEMQERLQKEIDQVMANHDQLSHEAIQKMKYLDMIISESLRLFPPIVLTDRVCIKDYTIPATDNTPEYTIKKGEGIWISIFAFHRDPEFFPDPEKFDPERFSDENKHKIKPYTYLPFGVGPRTCLGKRFALMDVKIGLVHLLSRFNIHVVPKTPKPIILTKSNISMAVDGGFWVGYTLRAHSK